MRIVVSSSGNNLDAATSPVFGRCPTYIFVDSETSQFEAVPNPAMAAGGGAGIQAAQFVLERGAQAVVSGNVGPNAFNVIQAASVPVYLFPGGSVRDAVEAFVAGTLQSVGGANVAAHAGLGMGGGMGRGRGMRGSGGMGGDMGALRTAVQPPSTPSHQDEIATLKDEAKHLRERLAQMVDQIEALDKSE